MVRAQLRAVVDDIGCDAAKIGMLSRPETITSVAEFLSETPLPNLVLDPVMVSKSGHRLLSAEALSTLKTRLLPKAALITPNLPEVGELLGYLPRTAEEMVRAAHHLGDLTPAAVLIKGGHLESGAIVDVLWDGSEIHRFDSSRLPAVHTHGTGCTLSAAIACQLALGWPLPQAVANAREYLRAAMQHAYPVGCGIGPVNHLWEFGDPKVAPQPVF
jgi:hydroxymethylpyrimidine/phosphomethylpyrimidine kinase